MKLQKSDQFQDEVELQKVLILFWTKISRMPIFDKSHQIIQEFQSYFTSQAEHEAEVFIQQQK